MEDISWQAPEFEYQHKRASWYLWAILVSGVFALAGILQKNFLFVIFIVVAAGVIIRTGRQTPKYVAFALTADGLVVDNKKVHHYDQLLGFATRRIDDLEDGLTELILQRKHRLSTYWKILFPTKRSAEIRHYLNQHLPEIEYEDTLSEHLSRLLKL